MANDPTPEFFSAQEGVASGDHHEMSAEELKARDRRNKAIALGIIGFILLVFFTTVLRLTQNVKANGGVVQQSEVYKEDRLGHA